MLAEAHEGQGQTRASNDARGGAGADQGMSASRGMYVEGMRCRRRVGPCRAPKPRGITRGITRGIVRALGGAREELSTTSFVSKCARNGYGIAKNVQDQCSQSAVQLGCARHLLGAHPHKSGRLEVAAQQPLPQRWVLLIRQVEADGTALGCERAVVGRRR